MRSLGDSLPSTKEIAVLIESPTLPNFDSGFLKGLFKVTPKDAMGVIFI